MKCHKNKRRVLVLIKLIDFNIEQGPLSTQFGHVLNKLKII